MGRVLTKKITKAVLITDLDNTLFDWFQIWYQPFHAMLCELIKISGVPRNTLIEEIKTVHQEHGTSEYVYLVVSCQTPAVGSALTDFQVPGA
jgi:hypothetical protein